MCVCVCVCVCGDWAVIRQGRRDTIKITKSDQKGKALYID